MKKIFTCFVLMVFTSVSIYVNGQCTVSVTPADTNVCGGSILTLSAVSVGPESTLTTTSAAGNGQNGNMFDITAINEVVIHSFDVSVDGSTNMAVYYKTGTHVGFESNSAAWTLIGAADVTYTGSFVPAGVPVNITIPAGQTYAFYITSTNTSYGVNYTDGVAVGNIYTYDTNIQFLEGAGIEYPFTNGGSGLFTPRVWNGVVHYSPVDGTASYLWSTTETNDTIAPVIESDSVFTVAATISGCATTVYDTVNITAHLINTAVSVLNETITADLTGVVYQWIDCGTLSPIAGETSQSFTATVNGSYAVAITDSTGCTAISECQDITSAGISDRDLAGTIRIFPNPAGNQLNIQSENRTVQLIQISDISGKVLVSMIPSGMETTLDVSDFAAGVYIIKLKAGDDWQIMQFMKE